MRRYIQQERDYRQCVRDEATQKMEESVTRANRMVEQWNCYASGSKICF